ncbi:MAG TPA: sigma-54 dependent transcriptional regulator [Blastocatellia bacterium]|nr:sigma-54 dependent transcriptional regulator [Blastocatellia bacterium]
MSIAIFAQAHFHLDEVVAALRRDGVEVLPVKLNSAPPPPLTFPATIKKAVLIMQEQGVVTVGDRTALVQSLVPPRTSLLLCAPHIAAADRQTLLDCGAHEIVTPRSWAPAHVAERILAELILENLMQPVSCGLLQGATPKMHELYRQLRRLAPLAEPILILGETGTGKELVAKEIHTLSGRGEPFLPVNCPEISPELLSSELFGHEKGAFTGAIQTRKGLIAAAGEGTIFLDEIGDLDPAAQAKLLRVIEDRKVRPIGATRLEPVQARMVFATNRNLEEDCAEGKFRKDLYERLRGFTLELPPLRERRADLPMLFRYFVDGYNQDYDQKLKIPSNALNCLFGHEWPGNVRELRLMARSAAAHADASGYISTTRLQESMRTRGAARPQHVISFDPVNDTWRDVLDRTQVAYFRAVLSAAGGNKEAAAKLAGLSRSQFYEKLKEKE